jgi:hypothetical protein
MDNLRIPNVGEDERSREAERDRRHAVGMTGGIMDG